MRIVFFGTPNFAAKTLSDLIDNGVDVAAVVSRPDKPKGRSGKLLPPPVKVIAQEKIPLVPIYQPVKVSTEEYEGILKDVDADLFVVVAYGEIIKQHILDIPKKGCINVHASLLPKYRGAAPIQRAIMTGDRESGVTIMRMVRKMDAGAMLKVEKVPIDDNTTAEALEQDLQKAGIKALLAVLKDFSEGSLQEVEQDENLVTFAPKIELEDAQIHWSLSAMELHNLIRAMTPAPGAWCWISLRGEKKRLKVADTKVVEAKGIPGEILSYGKEGVVIACHKNALLLGKMQPEGKKMMLAQQFCQGVPKDALKFL